MRAEHFRVSSSHITFYCLETAGNMEEKEQGSHKEDKSYGQ
jgi:hypothetical protein